MRRKEKEITDQKIIEEILSKSEVCRIAVMDGDRPYIIPLNYGYKDKVIYFHTAPHGKKIDLLKISKSVCFEIEYSTEIVKRELSCDWGARYRSVIGYGTVDFVTDFDQKKVGLDVIMAHYGKTDNNNYQDKQVDSIVVLKLNVCEITGKQSGKWD